MKKTERHITRMIKKNWKFPVLDGITNNAAFQESKYKILWILKEPNKTKKNEIWDHRLFHRNITCYDKWLMTYQKIIYSSYGILTNCLSFSKLPDIEENSIINGKNILHEIAIININKGGGGSTSNNDSIRRYYFKNKELLHDQIEQIQPDIIINTSRVWELFENITYEKIIGLKKDNFQYSKGKILTINTYHPNSRFSVEKYCNNIFHAFKAWKSETGSGSGNNLKSG